MAGFFLEGHSERIPCPHCGGTDCAGADRPADDPEARLVCCITGQPVTDAMLRAEVQKAGATDA